MAKSEPSTAENDGLLYSIGEAAQALHCSPATIRRLVKAGMLTGLSLGGSSGAVTRVTAQSVRDFVNRAGLAARKP